MTKYTTLLLDADETLLDFTAAEGFAIGKTCEKFGIPFSDEVRKTYSDINLSLWKQLEKGLCTREEIKLNRFITFTEVMHSSADPVEMGRFYESTLAGCGFIIEGADKLCEKLSRKYALYIVTNGLAGVQKGRLALSGLLPYFRGCFISEESGSAKPKKEFFDFVFHRIEEKDKSKICIIGDSLSSDVAGGINAGIDTCHFCRGEVPENDPATMVAEDFSALEKIFL